MNICVKFSAAVFMNHLICTCFISFSDDQTTGRARLDFKDNLSIPSNDKTETFSSLASGGKNSAKHPEEVELERALMNEKPGNKHSENKEIIPVPMTNISDGEEMFQPSEDNFFKLKMTAFNNDSANNSSCGSFTDHANGMISYERNFSLSPSPGSGENNISTENNLSGENDILVVNHSSSHEPDSKTGLGSCDDLSFREETAISKVPPEETSCDKPNISMVTDSAIALDTQTSALNSIASDSLQKNSLDSQINTGS